MPSFVNKKVYANRYIKEMTIEPQALAAAAQIIIIMIILMVSTTMQIQSTMPMGRVGQTTMQIQSLIWVDCVGLITM